MSNKTNIEEDIKILDEIIKGNEDCLKIDLANQNIEDAKHWTREIQAIETVTNAYYREKARADKLEKEYSKMLTKIDEYEADDKANKYDSLVEKIKQKKRHFEECDELIATSDRNYSDGTVIKRFIDTFQELLDTES